MLLPTVPHSCRAVLPKISDSIITAPPIIAQRVNNPTIIIAPRATSTKGRV